jgi:hypothetical protein
MRMPRSSTYRVQRGDCLWNIAKSQYGDALLWTHIADANGITNPRRLLVGLNLRLPAVPTPRGTVPGTTNGSTSGSTRGVTFGQTGATRKVVVGPPPLPPNVSSIPLTTGPAAAEDAGVPREAAFPAAPVIFPAVKYKLDDVVSPIVLDTPAFTMTVKLVGELSLQRKGVMAEVELASSGALSEKLKAEYHSALTNVAGQVKAKFNPTSRTLELSCGLTTTMKDAQGGVIASNQYEFTPPNRFKFTFRPRDVQGESGDVVYKGNVGFEVEVVVRTAMPQPVPVLAGQSAPITTPAADRTWVWVTAGTLVVAGAVIIVADLTKDVATLGVGAVESPLSFAAAAAMFQQAAMMTR